MTQRPSDFERIVYVKNGNAAQELRRTASLTSRPDGGPDAFMADFLALVASKQGLALSIGDETDETSFGNATARTLARGRGAPTHLWALGRAIARYEPDIVICGTLGQTLLVTTVASALNRAKFMISCHNRPVLRVGSLRDRIQNVLNATCLRRASAIVHHGPYIHKHLLTLGIDQDRLFPFEWSFTSLSAHASQTADSVDSHGRTVLFAGRLEAAKGIFSLLEALAPRLRGDASLTLRYAGVGGDCDALARAVAAMGLDRSVRLDGFLPRDQLARAISKAHVLAAPTHSSFPEGRCMTAMESLVLGVPIVAPDFGPFPHLVTDGVDGLLYTPDSTDALREALGRMLDDDALHARLRDGAAATGKVIRLNRNGFKHALREALDHVARTSPPSLS